jgi:hypothetical protein
MINNLKSCIGVLYYRPEALWHTSLGAPNDFSWSRDSARPDFRWQQDRISVCAEAAMPQGNHADFISVADNTLSDTKRTDRFIQRRNFAPGSYA